MRPHEALGAATPAPCYTRSPRPYPSSLPPLAYPPHFEVGWASVDGGIRWLGGPKPAAARMNLFL